MGTANRLFTIALLTTVLSVIRAGGQSPPGRVCNQQEESQALGEADGLKNWNAAHRFYQRFANCDDGAIAEGYSDSVGRLLSTDWKELDVLADLISADKRFGEFVLRHIDETVPIGVLQVIIHNASSRCPAGSGVLCQSILKRAKASPADNVPQRNVILGILEDVPGVYAGQADSRAVRVAFRKVGDNWKPFPSPWRACGDPRCSGTIGRVYPSKVTWTITWRGKNLGQVTTVNLKDYKFYSEVGLQKIISGGSIPTVGKRSLRYSGYLYSPVFRPLVAVSQPNFKNPDQWEPTRLSAELVASLREQFRLRFPGVTNCTSPEENVERPWQYRDEDIRVARAYSSRQGWSLAALRLTGWNCDGMLGDNSPFDLNWYTVDPAGKIRFLDASIWLVDVGDYDGSGRSEAVFAIDRNNRGGYELFYDNFRKHVVFQFGYH